MDSMTGHLSRICTLTSEGSRQSAPQPKFHDLFENAHREVVLCLDLMRQSHRYPRDTFDDADQSSQQPTGGDVGPSSYYDQLPNVDTLPSYQQEPNYEEGPSYQQQSSVDDDQQFEGTAFVDTYDVGSSHCGQYSSQMGSDFFAQLFPPPPTHGLAPTYAPAASLPSTYGDHSYLQALNFPMPSSSQVIPPTRSPGTIFRGVQGQERMQVQSELEYELHYDPFAQRAPKHRYPTRETRPPRCGTGGHLMRHSENDND